MTPRAVLPKCGSPERPSARTSSLRRRTAEPRPVGWELDAVDEFDAGPRIVGEQEIAVEVDVIHEARDLRAGSDPETRLDHAPEHDAETERTRRMHHAHRLADPACLRE